jgi:hypothetical protein
MANHLARVHDVPDPVACDIEREHRHRDAALLGDRVGSAVSRLGWGGHGAVGSLGRICPHQFDKTAHRNVTLARRLTFRGLGCRTAENTSSSEQESPGDTPQPVRGCFLLTGAVRGHDHHRAGA